MTRVETLLSGKPAGRLTQEQLQELIDTFEMRGLMAKEQARLFAHVEALERELRRQLEDERAGPLTSGS